MKTQGFFVRFCELSVLEMKDIKYRNFKSLDLLTNLTVHSGFDEDQCVWVEIFWWVSARVKVWSSV